MKFYNTLSRKLENFKPIKKGYVSIYSCGPTVYSYYHIGNLRNAVFNDTLRRSIENYGYEVKHVVNITDVGHLTSDGDEGEDKLEKGARVQGRTVWEVAEHYTESFKNDVSQLNILPPNGYQGTKDSYARATDFINQQIEIVSLLIKCGVAYQAEQAIYFDISKAPNYGELTGQALSDKELAARPDIVTDSAKRNPQDFALWFFATGHFKNHSMKWKSPWGDGFPGWHLECSAIIHATLGDPIDIHTGAVDLIGTHHTNESAQTEAAFGHKLANYWLHNEYVLVENQKMSKSKGNSYTLADVTKRGYNPLALRYLFLQSHYRSELNFTWEALSAAQNGLRNLWAWADLIFQQSTIPKMDTTNLSDLKIKLQSFFDDDMNTAASMAYISKVTDDFAPTAELLRILDSYLGLSLSTRIDISDNEKRIISERQAARDSGNWDLSDKLRLELENLGLAIKDTSLGPVWSRL